ncbi:hypothetical protein PAXRUDRAFT_170394, partial [Paxillus rubicundulus Ve08.2h10]
VYRINWLKARAKYCWWSEELTLVRHVMYLVRKWFEGQEEEWKGEPVSPGRQFIRPEQKGKVFYTIPMQRILP